jgi:hypothetical protein
VIPYLFDYMKSADLYRATVMCSVLVIQVWDLLSRKLGT